MGVSSVIKLIGPSYEIVYKEDFDKFLDHEAIEIARRLPESHPFRKLIDLVVFNGSRGVEDETIDKVEKSLGEDSLELGYLVIKPEDLAPFRDYTRGDVDKMWDDLFSGQRPGLFGWISYHLLGGKRMEAVSRENGPSFFIDLIKIIQKADDEKLLVVRHLY